MIQVDLSRNATPLSVESDSKSTHVESCCAGVAIFLFINQSFYAQQEKFFKPSFSKRSREAHQCAVSSSSRMHQANPPQ